MICNPELDGAAWAQIIIIIITITIIIIIIIIIIITNIIKMVWILNTCWLQAIEEEEAERAEEEMMRRWNTTKPSQMEVYKQTKNKQNESIQNHHM